LSPRRFSVVPHGLSYYDSRTRTSRLLIRTISLWARHCSVNCNKKVNIKNASATTLKQIGKDEKWLQDWLTADPAPNRGGARL
jgi:hypothetical protein